MKAILACITIVFLQALCSIPLFAATPPFTQCSPSGYNCNMLISVDRNGTVTIDSDWNNYYYPPFNLDTVKLIGFQNNSRGTVYSIRIVATSMVNHPSVCLPPTNPTLYVAPGVNYFNIPFGGDVAWPPGPTPPLYWYFWPYSWPWGFSCDIVFPGGVPKGGKSYFSLASSWFQAQVSAVSASLSFPQNITEGQTLSGTVTLYPSPSPTPVTLALTTTSGTGSAVFASPTTFTQSGSFQITGVQRSSTAVNIKLSATANSQEVSKTYFTVSAPKPIITGPKTVWWFNGEDPNPTAYPTSVTLSATGNAANMTWSVTQGSHRITLAASGNQATVRSSGSYWSGTQGDISVTATADGMTSDPFTITTKRPVRLAANPLFSGTECDVVTNAWYTTVAYDLMDNFENMMEPNAGWNEALGTPSCPSDSNWCSVPIQQQPGATGPVLDRLQPPYFPGVSPVPNCQTPPSGMVLYRSIPQNQFVGSSTTGNGVFVQNDFLGYYIDHGQHDVIVVPPGPPE
jgi:hypothetical protein